MKPMRRAPANLAQLNSGHDFCVGRMVTKVGLAVVATLPDADAAKARLEELSRKTSEHYLVFQRGTGRVIAKSFDTKGRMLLPRRSRSLPRNANYPVLVVCGRHKPRRKACRN